ncbi:MAG: hypothetical protein HY937_03185 [Nitrosomonadales bacterium]|nr:hypothetical protein [Nitrosomonadales bacterium]
MKKLITVAPLRAVLGFWFIVALFVFGNIPAVKAEDTQSLEGEWAPTSSSSRWDSITIVRQDGGYNVIIKYKPNEKPPAWSGFYQGNATQIITSRNIPSEHFADDFPAPVIRALAGKITYRYRFTLSIDGRSAEFAIDKLGVNYYQNTGEMHDYFIAPFAEKTTMVRVPTSPTPTSPAATTAVSSPQEILVQVQQRQKEAHELNEQGVQYWKNKQYQQAADAFEAALDKNPDDKTIRENYKQAVAALAAETAERRTTPLTGVGPADTAGGHTALDQAHTSDKETRKGLESGGLENMKEQSNKVFDKPVPLQSSGINPAVDLRNVGKAPLPTFVRKDKEIIQMQKTRDAFLATRQKKDAELAQIRKEIEAETDSAKKGDLMVKAAQIKAESSQAEYEAALKDKDIQKRAKLLIDTHVEEAPSAPGDQKTTPPDAPKAGH